MKNPKYIDVQKKMESWESYYSDNNARANRFVDFCIAGNQWDETVVAGREGDNKESLTFNITRKHLLRAVTQLKEIEFGLNIVPTNNEYLERVDETNAFRLSLNTILLGDETVNNMSYLGEKCLKNGYAYAEVSYRYSSPESLFLEPYLIVRNNIEQAFWDKSAPNLTRTLGRFCGNWAFVSAAELEKYYSQTKRASWVKAENNKVTTYWWTECETMDFILLKTGEYKREDCLTYDDKNNLAKGTKKMPKRKKREVSFVYKKRMCGEYDLESPALYPTKRLPQIYHFGLTDWRKEGEFTTPYVYHLEGAQKLHNYTLSQAATQAKNISGPKYFLDKEQVTTQTSRANAEKINQKEGALTFDGDPRNIIRHDPPQLSQTVVELSQIAKQEADEINGAMINTENAQQTVISGKALDKITHNIEIINAYFTASHIQVCNEIGILYREMIPELYTEERTLIVKQKDGSGEAIVINQDVGTGKLLHNIKDINSNFHYEITASPNSLMMRENTNRYLLQLYAIDPTLLGRTADIFFRNSQSQDSGELERRVLADMDDALVNYSQGAISKTEYQKIKQEKQQQQMQQQAEMAKLDPQVQSANALAAAEHRKAGADEQNAQTKRMEVIGKLKNENDKLKADMLKSILEAKAEEGYQQIEEFKAQLELNDQILQQLESERNAASQSSD
jgi:hypothetical protein